MCLKKKARAMSRWMHSIYCKTYIIAYYNRSTHHFMPCWLLIIILPCIVVDWQLLWSSWVKKMRVCRIAILLSTFCFIIIRSRRWHRSRYHGRRVSQSFHSAWDCAVLACLPGWCRIALVMRFSGLFCSGTVYVMYGRDWIDLPISNPVIRLNKK